MRKFVMAAGLIAGVMGTSSAFAADPTGLWLTPTKNGQIQISKCGASLCGRLVSSDNLKSNPSLKDVNNKKAALRDRPLKGLTILTGFTGGPKEWSGGHIYNAEDGNTYSGSITMVSDNKLSLRGCVIAPLCKSQTWTRVQ